MGPTKIASVAVTGTQGELLLETPDDPVTAGQFGFVDKDGSILTVAASGVVLAEVPGMPWRALSAHTGRTCGAAGNGEIHCWGASFSSGPPAGAYRQVVVGGSFGCALDFSDTLACWGSAPAIPAGSYLQLAAGSSHVCALKEDLDIECFGGTIGDPAAGSGPFVMLSRGFDHACAIEIDGAVVCWGNDSYGETNPDPGSYVDLAGGADHSCGILSDGSVDCWGRDNEGQSTPTGIPGGRTAVDITAGANHTCVILDDASVVCWGASAAGQTSPPSGSFRALSAEDLYTCGIRADGAAECWGDTGEITTADEPPFVPFPQVAAGDTHTCEIRSDGSLDCFSTDSVGTPARRQLRAARCGRPFRVCRRALGQRKLLGRRRLGALGLSRRLLHPDRHRRGPRLRPAPRRDDRVLGRQRLGPDERAGGELPEARGR